MQDWVFIVEGERDADRLYESGFVATCCPMGAGKWRREYNQYFKGRLVAIIPDNDSAGKTHAEQIAESLYGTAGQIRIVELPGLPEKGDFSDWCAAGGTNAELIGLLDEAKPYEPSNAENREVGIRANGGKSQATLLVELAEEMELFHDAEGNAFITISIDQHLETWRIKSQGFRRWLNGQFWRECHKAPGAQAMQGALGVLSSKAMYEGSEHSVFVRLGEYEGAVWLDMANADWQAIQITAAGWQISERPPVKFLRPRGLLPLPLPKRGGNIRLLREFLNLACEDDWVLALSWLMAALRPTGPYPLLVVNGEQGSAKTTLCRVLRGLVDPNAASLRAAPRDTRDLMIAASNSWILGYDNLSSIPPWLSDAFCRLATGGGFATRELYSDSEEVILDVMRPIIINGIEELATRSDLLDRSINLTLPTIADADRRTEAELWRDIRQLQPQILGALLDGVSRTMRRLPSVRLQSPPRMADFAVWSVAAEEGLGFAAGAFLAAYGSNRDSANGLAIEASALGSVIQEFVAEKGLWEGTAQGLLVELERHHSSEQAKNRRDWPKTPQYVGKILRRLAPNLRLSGVDVRFGRDSGRTRRRTIQLERTDILPSEMSVPSDRHPEDCLMGCVSDMSDGSDNKIQRDS